MIVITGLGRCGTSALAKFCKELGYDPGGEWVENIRAGFEDLQTTQINIFAAWIADGMPRVERPDLVAYIQELQDEIREVARSKKVVKDPMFTLFPAFVIALWAGVLKDDLKIIYLTRDLRNIKRSRVKLGNSGEYLYGTMAVPDELYQVPMARFINTCSCWNLPIRIFNYPDFINQYDAVAGCLKDFGLTFDLETGRKIWNETMDTNKKTVWR